MGEQEASRKDAAVVFNALLMNLRLEVYNVSGVIFKEGILFFMGGNILIKCPVADFIQVYRETWCLPCVDKQPKMTVIY